MLSELTEKMRTPPANPFDFIPKDEKGNFKDEKKFTSLDYLKVLHGLGFDFQLRVLDDMLLVNGQPMSDPLHSTIKSKVRDLGLRNVDVMYDHIVAYASERPLHPILDYFDNLTWDGRGHIATLASFFSDENALFPVALTRWLIGAVAKAYRAERNRMLVLDGPQRMGKSYFVRWLAEPVRDYFTEGAIDPDNKDHLIQLISNLVWEVAELGSTTRRADQEALKDFLTKRKVTVRVPYGHHPIIKPALCSFIGTVNDIGGFLSDPTGHTRFMSVKLTGIDHGYSELVDVNQVWAEAVARYKMGETWEPTGDELTKVDAVNESYEVEDPLTEMIQKYFYIDAKHADWFTATTQIIEILHADGWKLPNQIAEARAISSALKPYGLRRSNVIPRGYFGVTRKNQ